MPWLKVVSIIAGLGVLAFIAHVVYVFFDERWNGDRS